MTKQTIAITGANGYIGSYLANFLKNKGYCIIKFGRKRDNESRFVHYELNKKNNNEDFHGIDILIHCAYDFSLADYHISRTVNVLGTQQLFAQARANGVKKIIYLSSTSAFEKAVANYGRIKFETESIARQYQAIIIRPGLVFSQNAGGIIKSMSAIIEKLPIVPLIGANQAIFLPCHVADLANLIEFCFVNELGSKPIVAGCEQMISFKHLLQLLAKQRNKKILLCRIPYAFLYCCLKVVELLKVDLGLRSDSIKYFKYFNANHDLSFIKLMQLSFRPMTVSSLNESV